MRRTSHVPLLHTVLIAFAVVCVASRGGLAHEQRKVGLFSLTVGWSDEPPYVGVKNRIELLVRDAAGRPVRDLGDSLTVEVIFASERTGPLPLTPAEDGASTGAYEAPIIPTRPGRFAFRFSGSIRGHKVDETFALSESTDAVLNPSVIEFPAKDPTRAELAGLLERLQSRTDALRAKVDAAWMVAIWAGIVAVAAILVGAMGLVVGLQLRRRRGGPA